MHHFHVVFLCLPPSVTTANSSRQLTDSGRFVGGEAKRDRSDIVKLGGPADVWEAKRDRSDIVKLGGPADV